jgi:hypothetical protein
MLIAYDWPNECSSFGSWCFQSWQFQNHHGVREWGLRVFGLVISNWDAKEV